MIKRLTHNWLPKLISVALAIIAWYFISLNVATTSQRNLEIPVSVVGLEQTQTISETIDKVEITVSGDSRQVDRLVPENFTATLNVAGLSGEYTQSIEVIPPQGINVDNVSPEISIGTIETISSKTVPVSMAFLPGQDLNSILQIAPSRDTVTVQGRESVLAQVTQATGLIPAQAGEVNATLYASDANNIPITTSEVSLEPSSIAVSVISKPVLHTKAVPVIVETPTLEDFTVKAFSLSQSVITIAGPETTLQNLEQVNGSIILPETLAAQDYSLPVRLELPDDLSALQNITAQFTLETINPLTNPE
jgi:YbbR domain-containing protein